MALNLKTSLTTAYTSLLNKMNQIRSKLTDMGVSIEPIETLSTINTDILKLTGGVIPPHRTNCQDWRSIFVKTNFVANDMCTNGTLFVAVGYIGALGYIVYSKDGIDWQFATAPTTVKYLSVCYGNGKFVAISDTVDSSFIATSADGISWVESTTSVPQTNNKIIYANNIFLIIGNTAVFLTSTDAVTWFQRDTAITGTWVSVSYGCGKFIAVQSGSATALTSINGTTWATLTLPISGTWIDISTDNVSVFIITAASISLRSADSGVTWTQLSQALTKITYGNDVFFADNGSGDKYASYNLGSTWVHITTVAQKTITNVKYIKGLFFFLPTAVTYFYVCDAVLPILKENTGFGKLMLDGYDSALEQGTSMYPQTGEGWEVRTGASTSTWTGICYGAGLFVAIGYNVLMTSPDGITWTLRAVGATEWKEVCYGNGMFVAISFSDNITTSPDGINWTSRTVPESTNWVSICYGAGIFVAISVSDKTMTSPDGINWTSRTCPANVWWKSICYGNGLFVAVSRNLGNKIMTSPDGINWTIININLTQLFSICYGNGMFVAANYDTDKFIISSDGVIWTEITVPISLSWYSVCYGNGIFIGLGSGNNKVIISNDGISWAIKNIPVSDNWSAMCYGNGMFAAIALSSDKVITSGTPIPKTPNAVIGSFVPTAALNTINCKFRPDKVFITARGLNVDGKRFCKINITDSDKFKVNGTECLTYTVYNNSGAVGTFVTDTANRIYSDGFICNIPTALLYTGVVYDYYAIGGIE